ncbi:protein kinase [Streptomyces sp. NPDC060194]|uniref:serine/threonine-protein kinase n=1 Tax=Streptomyces sp. NPDC060194 TaxID=3347069 RepID=UPI00365AC30B
MSGTPGGTRRVADRYLLLDALGAGGMGTVWRARDELLGREVAVKEVKAPQGFDTGDSSRLYARLEREAWAAARISHRNVVTVYDVATEDGRPWIVMELVRGLTLADVLDGEGPMEPARAAHVGAEVLAALRAAHDAGVLHRDVKPGNVLIANDGRVVLTDFGIATVEGTSALTMTGELIGSPEYLAPERALGRTPGPESDLWSLGVLLYAAVQGSSPFRLDTPLSTLRAVVDEELPPPDRAGPLEPVLEGLLRKDPAERLTAEQAEHDLRIVAAGGTVGGPPPTGTTRAVPYAAPVPAPVPYGPDTRRTGPVPLAAPVSPTTATADPAYGGDGQRNAGLLVIIGLLVLLLAGGGTAWYLSGRDGENGNGSGTDTAGAAAGGAGESPSQKPTERSTAPEEERTTPAEPEETTKEESTPPPEKQRITVEVSAERDSYEGPCPAPEDEQPLLKGEVEVTVAPARAEYRWVSSAGASDWSALSFAEGEKKQEVRVNVPTGTESYRAEAVLQVRAEGVRQVNSEPLPYTVTCEDDGEPSGEPSEPTDGGGGGEDGGGDGGGGDGGGDDGGGDDGGA